MKYLRKWLIGGSVGLVAVLPSQVNAQDDADTLMSMSEDALKSEIRTRYDRGLVLSLDDAIISADNNRFMWANEAKVQCGIALGFLKSSTKDRSSISKCALAAQLMEVTPPPAVSRPAPQPVARQEFCDEPVTGTVFFDFDSADVPPSASETLAFVQQNAGPCNWTSIEIVGHTDRSGSDAYNDRLSRERADAVAKFLAAGGISLSMVTATARGENEPRVPTPDGERNPQNRRVEISAK
ncbi:OmpA family protein [Pontixanthobacter gangjinensis]|uniref:OmpA family protein n=1 Tax=Pontixanthobacter gangjinensis TaxID=1028742 RepID=A0A6I4SQM2_9SPHN|nr:OmpA family protein [Pontixanthobacter gangjinensis]MXO57929.1 OmpA family protein [Pontixanthobacter gangjinensis]